MDGAHSIPAHMNAIQPAPHAAAMPAGNPLAPMVAALGQGCGEVDEIVEETLRVAKTKFHQILATKEAENSRLAAENAELKATVTTLRAEVDDEKAVSAAALRAAERATAETAAVREQLAAITRIVNGQPAIPDAAPATPPPDAGPAGFERERSPSPLPHPSTIASIKGKEPASGTAPRPKEPAAGAAPKPKQFESTPTPRPGQPAQASAVVKPASTAKAADPAAPASKKPAVPAQRPADGTPSQTPGTDIPARVAPSNGPTFLIEAEMKRVHAGDPETLKQRLHQLRRKKRYSNAVSNIWAPLRKREDMDAEAKRAAFLAKFRELRPVLWKQYDPAEEEEEDEAGAKQGSGSASAAAKRAAADLFADSDDEGPEADRRAAKRRHGREGEEDEEEDERDRAQRAARSESKEL